MKTLVAVIAFNEAENIRATLEELIAFEGEFDIVVVDNGSSDGTPEICRELGVPVVRHCTNTGGSMGTVKTYFLYADHHGYDILCQFDSDGQHIAAELPKVIEPVRAGEADYVIGSRFLERDGDQSTALRRLGIRLFSWLDSVFIGQKVTDVTSGQRAYGRRVIRFFGRCYDREIMDTSQLLLTSHSAGARILEVPVRMRERRGGESEFHFTSSLSFIARGLVNVLGSWLLRRREREMIGETDAA